MAKEKSKHKKKILSKFSLGLWILSIILMTVLGYFIFQANVLPFKYFIAIVIIFVLVLAIHGLLVLKKRTKSWVLIFVNIITIAFMSVEAFAIFKINDTLTFLRNNLGAYFETNVYNIVVNKESDYDTLESLQGHKLTIYKDMDDMSEFEKSLKFKLDNEYEYQENVAELLENIKEDKEMILIVNSGNYDAMLDMDKDFEGQVKIIDTIIVTTQIEQQNTGINVTKDPFVVYLSGIDTRSNYLPSRSLSDVNMIIAINPETRRILMVHIPRDYYVKLHGTEGLNDKLTHAGTIGGIELSMSTISDLLEIELPYYVRVNFNSVVNLVDAIGGLSINSDVNYSFNCYTDRGCTFHPGINNVGGRCALAFARERYAYESGDRHRGENQEQIIQLIIDKVTSSSTLINNYSEILKALDGTFQTNITEDEITSLVKMQINDMRGWDIETANVTGTGASMPTYSYPNQNLYVMNPDMESVKVAVSKLDEVLGTTNE